jgi:hypothetical protein
MRSKVLSSVNAGFLRRCANKVHVCEGKLDDMESTMCGLTSRDSTSPTLTIESDFASSCCSDTAFRAKEAFRQENTKVDLVGNMHVVLSQDLGVFRAIFPGILKDGLVEDEKMLLVGIKLLPSRGKQMPNSIRKHTDPCENRPGKSLRAMMKAENECWLYHKFINVCANPRLMWPKANPAKISGSPQNPWS